MSPQSTTILLTGAAQGIGRATAFALADRGYRLGLIDRASGPLGGVAESLRASGATVAAEAADVGERSGFHEAIRRVESSVGHTDVLVACAGVGTLSNVFSLDTPGLREMLLVNVLGVAHAIEGVLPGMLARRSGHLVAISSVAGYRGLPWMPGYSASKAAVSTYLEGLRPALKLRGIRVTNVCPGFVRTGLTASTPFRRPVPMLEPEQAATHIVRAIEKGTRDYVFPWNARIGMGLLRRLPNRVFDWLMDRAGPRALTSEF